jgi:hypothetical protein
MRLALTAVVIAILFSAASEAEAAQRYATPSGSGEFCSETVPCSLAVAIKKAQSGDEVIVGAGTYEVGPTLAPKSDPVFIHGDFSGAMPKIVGTGKGNAPIISQRLSYLEIIAVNESKATAAACNPGQTMERVRLVAESQSMATGLLLISQCTVTDSVVVAAGPGAQAVHAYGYMTPPVTGLVRNLTAIATGPGSIGVEAEDSNSVEPGSYQLDVRNSIVSGAMADLVAAKGAGGPGNIVVTNSNFDSSAAESPATLTGAANQTAPPLFVDAAAGDYREAPGSPTIDAGSSEGISALDLAGNPRSLGAAPDIGAFELVPPALAARAALTSLSLSPRSFRPRPAGGAIISARGARSKGGATVRYALTGAATVEFVVERRIAARRVGRSCVKQGAANRGRKPCALYRPLKGGFADPGAAGPNSVGFSGRVRGRALKPARYRLVARAGESIKTATFRITR